MPKLTRLRTILCKIESSYASDPTPTGGSNAIEVRNLEITPLEADVVERETIRGYLGNYPQLLSQQRVSLTFEVELAASGAAGTAPAWGPAMKACAMSQTIVSSTSVTYAPVSSSFDSCTFYVGIDGIRHKITGARGSFSLNASVGEIPVISFTFTGIYNDPTDTALPTCTYANQADPVIFKNGNTTALQIFSYSASLQSFSYDQNNETIYNEFVGGTKEILVTDRKPAGEAVIEAPALSAKNFFTTATGSATGNLTFQHGQTAGNKVTFTAGQIDIASPAYTEENGIQMLSLPYVATPTSAGNNEISLALT